MQYSLYKGKSFLSKMLQSTFSDSIAVSLRISSLVQNLSCSFKLDLESDSVIWLFNKSSKSVRILLNSVAVSHTDRPLNAT